MYEAFLNQLGLSQKEALIYETLLKIGQATPQFLARETKLNRVTVYALLRSLEEKKLTSQIKKKGKIHYRIEHPSRLEELIKQKEEEVSQNKKSLDQILPNLISSYNLVSQKPSVKYFEGLEGLKKIYDDILAEGKDFLLIRSPYEEKTLGTKIVQGFIKKRVQKKMKVQAITPDVRGERPELDKAILYSRTWVRKDFWQEPIEIDIYGHKVAFLSFEKEIIGVIIESKQIAKAMKKIFTLACEGAKATYKKVKSKK